MFLSMELLGVGMLGTVPLCLCSQGCDHLTVSATGCQSAETLVRTKSDLRQRESLELKCPKQLAGRLVQEGPPLYPTLCILQLSVCKYVLGRSLMEKNHRWSLH